MNHRRIREARSQMTNMDGILLCNSSINNSNNSNNGNTKDLLGTKLLNSHCVLFLPWTSIVTAAASS